MIAVVYVAHVRFALNAILAFWIAYILTRPLGASIGDYLSQPKADGGLGLGTTVTSVVFLLTILGIVIFLTVTSATGSSRRPCRPCGAQPGRRAFSWSPTRRPRRPPSSRPCGSARPTGPAEFVMLVPNPAHLAFDRPSPDTGEGEHLLGSLPFLSAPAGTQVEGRVAASPNAFDDIVAELGQREYSEIILETSRRTSRTGCTSTCHSGWPASATR